MQHFHTSSIQRQNAINTPNTGYILCQKSSALFTTLTFFQNIESSDTRKGGKIDLKTHLIKGVFQFDDVHAAANAPFVDGVLAVADVLAVAAVPTVGGCVPAVVLMLLAIILLYSGLVRPFLPPFCRSLTAAQITYRGLFIYCIMTYELFLSPKEELEDQRKVVFASFVTAIPFLEGLAEGLMCVCMWVGGGVCGGFRSHLI